MAQIDFQKMLKVGQYIYLHCSRLNLLLKPGGVDQSRVQWLG